MEITARHVLLDSKVQVYQRVGSPVWQCSYSLNGRQFRRTTQEESLAQAKDVARDLYLTDLGKIRNGEELTKKRGKTFREAAARFMDEYEVITLGQRSPLYVKRHRERIGNQLNPFFGDMVLTDITPGVVQDYRIHRMKNGRARWAHIAETDDKRNKPPAQSTLKQEIVCLRQILKTAERLRWIEMLPNLTNPFRGSTKISHRAWFSPEEYRQLYSATRERAKKPPKPRWRHVCEDLHDFVLFMGNTGLRPDEAMRLEFRDVAVVTDEATRERILEIEVRGKRGVGYCKSMPGAVLPFERLKERNKGQPTDRTFRKSLPKLLATVLREQCLHEDRDGQLRSAYSLRHTYICLRLIEGADIYALAKNCRTSVEMIEKHYAAHIKDMLDASAINVRKARPGKRSKSRKSDEY